MEPAKSKSAPTSDPKNEGLDRFVTSGGMTILEPGKPERPLVPTTK